MIGNAYSGSVELTYDIPTQRVDGSELTLAEIDKYVLSYGTTIDASSTELYVEGNITSVVITDLYGVYYFKIATKDTDGQVGPWSNTISEDMGTLPINPIQSPTNVSAVESITVYWDLPTKRVDGTVILPEDINSFVVAYKCNDRLEEQKIVQGNAASTVLHGLYGDCSFKVRAEDTSGLGTSWSEPYNLLIKLRTPKRGGFK